MSQMVRSNFFFQKSKQQHLIANDGYSVTHDVVLQSNLSLSVWFAGAH